MKFLFLLSIVMIAACNGKPQTKSCKDLRTGKFGFWGNDSDRKYFIERNDSVQIETDEMSGAVMEFLITWPSPCEYDLVFNRFIKRGSDSLQNLRERMPVHTEILKVSPDYYVFKSRIDGYNLEMTDTMGISGSY